MDFDPHGQPYGAVNASRRTVRDLCEMLGVVKGVLADGRLVEEEAHALAAWMNAHKDVMRTYPGRVVGERLQSIFRDGVIDEMERRDLRDLLEDMVGGAPGLIGDVTAPTDLPLYDPPPTVEVTDRVFVLTGRFAFGPRGVCENALRKIGPRRPDLPRAGGRPAFVSRRY